MKYLPVLWTMVLLLAVNPTTAQALRISAYGQEGIVMGDFAKRDINNGSAGYVDYGSVGGIEFNVYTKSKVGFGLRWTGASFGRDIESYESDLKESLGITNEPYDFTQTYSYWAFGSDFGIMYLMDISQKLQIEPYLYLGFKLLVSLLSSVIFLQNSTTYQYRSKSQLYAGASYAPGVRLHWNVVKRFGVWFSLEYDGSSFFKDEERSLLSSYNTLEISDTERKYRIHSLNFGIGLAYRFGKGIR